VRVLIVHQHDPFAPHIGGIGTFINTFVEYAPADFELGIVGVSRDPERRRIGHWHRLAKGDRSIDFLPVAAAAERPGRLPLSMRFVAGLLRHARRIDTSGAIVEFHRVEPTLAFRRRPGTRVLVLHGDRRDFYSPKTESVWGRAPALYFGLEDRLLASMDRIYSVREDSIPYYRDRHPRLADRFAFLPTWADPRVFGIRPGSVIERDRRELALRHGLDPSRRLLLFIGRFEGQKDPLLLLRAFRELRERAGDLHLVLIGAGALEPELRRFAAEHGLDDAIRFLGLQPPEEIARWMNMAHCLCLSSAYEGMPRVVVEALHCGLPVVTTDVGETRRLIGEPAAGRRVREHTPGAFADALEQVLEQPRDRAACARQVRPYSAEGVLAGFFADYRSLALGSGLSRSSRAGTGTTEAPASTSGSTEPAASGARRSDPHPRAGSPDPR
jgi:glycosyltransferase involved in cell wall biosynthesis